MQLSINFITSNLLFVGSNPVQDSWMSTMYIRDIDRFNLILGLSQFLQNAPSYLRNKTHFKSGQKWPENNHLDSFTKVMSKSLIHSVCPNRWYSICLIFQHTPNLTPRLGNCWTNSKRSGEQTNKTEELIFVLFHRFPHFPPFLSFFRKIFFVGCAEVCARMVVMVQKTTF